VLGANAPEIHPDAIKGSYVYLQVVDTGTGIPPEIIQKVFDPFFTTKADGKGTGLGLSTVAGIVKSHDGFITLESELGKGTAFTVYLPASPGECGLIQTLPAEIEPAPSAAVGGAGETVLVVDDEPSVRTAATRTLENHGYRVHMAEDGRDALALYYQRREQIALIITDYDMEMMDGLALSRAIKNVAPEAKIIVSSGQCPSHIRSQFNKIGVDWFLDKPYAPRQLVAAVNEALSGRSALS
jgi:two-component system cell cycle sensor histidine kinase/response regulator CckA